MQDFVFGRRYWIRFLVLSAGLVTLGLVSSAVFGFEATSIEDGPLEIGQEVLLAATIGFYLAAAVFQRGAGRMASVGAAVLAVVFFLRELELPVSGPVTAYLNSGAFRWHEAFVVLAIMLPYIAARRRLVPVLLAFLRTREVLPFIAVGILLLVGDYFDGIHFHGTSLAMFLEETAEALGYLAFAVTGYTVLRNARGR